MHRAPVPLPLADRLLLNVALYACVLGAYFAAGSIPLPPLHVLRTALDDRIPFVPAAMVGYGLAYVLPVSGLWLARDEETLRRLIRTVLLAYLAAAPFFVAFPVRDADPPVAGESWVERLLEANRAADRTKNAFPSMHVGLATILTLVAWRTSRAWGVALTAATAVIMVSTLLVKQHFIVDLPAGALVGWLAFRATWRADGEEEPGDGGPAAGGAA